MRSNEELNEMLKTAIAQVQSLGIVVGKIDSSVFLSRAKKTYGYCRQTGDSFTIFLSKYFIDNDAHEVMEILAHEVLHTVKGCMNHGAHWKAAAALVNNAYSYNISRASSYSMGLLNVSNYKYLIICKNCGRTEYRERKSNIVKNPEAYQCKCGGSLKVQLNINSEDK